MDEAEENNLDDKVLNERWKRWCVCSLCEQLYHGGVRCALGWACWKTYVGRPEEACARSNALTQLGNGLFVAEHYEDALPVQEAVLSMDRRNGLSQHNILISQTNLACTYSRLGRLEEASQMDRDIYSGRAKLHGEEDERTLRAALNYASSLTSLERFEEARKLLLKTISVARRVLGKGHDLTLTMRWIYANALYQDGRATLDDLREAATTLEEIEPIKRRVLGGAHPDVSGENSIQRSLELVRAKLASIDA
jgi:tetratricopeptide (TPR) repeat protein